MTYYDRLNAFFSDNEIDPLPPAAQLVYLHLIHENNRLKNPNAFCFTDSRLAALTGLSKPAIATAKRVLKNHGLINFKTDKKNPRAGTLYSLPENREKSQDSLTINDGRQMNATGAVISSELKSVWKANNDGTPPSETEAYYLAEDAKLYGEDKVQQAIIRAGQKKRGSLSIYFYKMQLGDVTGGRKENTNARRNTGHGGNPQTVSEYDRGADICPED